MYRSVRAGETVQRTSSADLEELQRARVSHRQEMPQCGMGRLPKLGIAGQNAIGGNSRALIQQLVAKRIGNPERRQPMLASPEQVSHAAKREVGAGYLEAILGARKQ